MSAELLQEKSLLTLGFILAAGRDVNNICANVLFLLDLNNIIIFIDEAVVDLRELCGKANNFIKSDRREFLC